MFKVSIFRFISSYDRPTFVAISSRCFFLFIPITSRNMPLSLFLINYSFHATVVDIQISTSHL